MFHAQGSGERGVGFEADGVGGAQGGEGGVGVEGVEFDLVYGGVDAWGGGQEFGDLDAGG